VIFLATSNEWNPSVCSEITDIKKRIDGFRPSLKYPHDGFGLVAVSEAYEALISGNFGIGAVLVNKSSGNVILKAHNSVFHPFFRSDMHAEMNLLTQYENLMKGKSGEIYKDLVLYTSLEPCPMCLTRILISGISEVHYLASDSEGGMVSVMDTYPKIWQEFLKDKIIEKAVCSPDLESLAFDTFAITGKILDNKLEMP
jgi:tRNA(adenine34) deaminase